MKIKYKNNSLKIWSTNFLKWRMLYIKRLKIQNYINKSK